MIYSMDYLEVYLLYNQRIYLLTYNNFEFYFSLAFEVTILALSFLTSEKALVIIPNSFFNIISLRVGSILIGIGYLLERVNSGILVYGLMKLPTSCGCSNIPLRDIYSIT